MIDTFRTFTRRRRLPTFAQAINWHSNMKEPTLKFLRERQPKIKRALDSLYLVELWDGLMNRVDPDIQQTVMAACTDLTMPIEFAPIIRRQGGAAAAFAYCELVAQLVGVKDLEDDMEVRDAMKRGWLEFQNRANEANDVSEGFGCDKSASWLTLREIGNEPHSQGLKAKMLAIARLAGRMFESFGYQRKEWPNENPEEVVGAKTGGEIERLFSSELALLADPDCEDQQTMKILEAKATVQQTAGREEKNRGPLVLCIDESGSMHDGSIEDWEWVQDRDYGMFAGRNTWAKACAVALTRIAWSEGRPVRCVHFGTSTEVQEVPKDDIRALFEMARSFLSGGTSFGEALKRGRAVVGDLKEDGFDGADILLITDGQDWDHDSHNREIDHMDRDGIRLWTISIGCDIPEEDPVRKRCEKYTYAADDQLSDPTTAVTLAAGLDKAALANAPGSSEMN